MPNEIELNELWISNAKEHAMLLTQIEDLKAHMDVVPILVKYVIMPLIIILGLPLGVERIVPMFRP